MDTQGYTRRDHRNRKKHSRRRNEKILDKMLKIFFYILIVLVVIIVIKVAFDGKDDDKDSGKQTTTLDNQNKNEDSTTTTNGNNASENSGDSAIDSTTEEVDSETSSEKDTQESSENQTTEEKTTEEITTEESTTKYTATGDYSLFNNAAFVGDSRVGGLYLSSQLTTTTFYYDIGGNVSSAVNVDSVLLENGSYGTMIEALQQKQFEKIFIQYGVNEWGWNTNSFISKYETLINEIKKVQPNATIYVMAIIPVTAEYAVDRADGAMNVNLKLDEMDAELKKMAEKNGINYINVVEAITGGERVLAPNMSSDGYHLNRSYNLKLLDYICEIIK